MPTMSLPDVGVAVSPGLSVTHPTEPKRKTASVTIKKNRMVMKLS